MTHGGLWANDPWYRRAWLVGPQAATMLVAGFLIWSVNSGAPTQSRAPWATPIPSASSPQDWDALRDKAKTDRSAFVTLKAAAEAGDLFAQFCVGTLYDPILKIGQATSPDLDVAISWYLKAAEQGHLPAQINLATLFHSDKFGRAPDYERAAFWNEKAADQGDLNAMQNLANILYTGQGMQVDRARSFRVLSEAATRGSPVAQLDLGRAYARGNEFVQADPTEAAKWYERSASSNNTQAMNLIGIAYAEGKGVDRSIDRARYWFKRGADAGNKDSAANLQKLPPS